MIARMMPSLSTRQIINAVGDKIVKKLMKRSFVGLSFFFYSGSFT
jgi:hypothetical protein